jgi:hypothetical protein
MRLSSFVRRFQEHSINSARFSCPGPNIMNLGKCHSNTFLFDMGSEVKRMINTLHFFVVTVDFLSYVSSFILLFF